MRVLFIATVFLAFGCGPMIGNISHKEALALYSAKTSDNEQTLLEAARIIDGRCRVAMESTNTLEDAAIALKHCAQMMERLAERSATIETQPPKYTEAEVRGIIALRIFIGNTDDANLNLRFEALTQNLRRWTEPYKIAVACLENSRTNDALAECLQKVKRASFMRLPTEVEKLYDAGLEAVFYCADQTKKYDQYKDKNEYARLMTRCIVATRIAIEKTGGSEKRYQNPIYQYRFQYFSKIFYLALIYFGTSAECASDGAKDITALFACMDTKIKALKKKTAPEPKK